jgi:ABC-type proline/glycine betaine transport system substrate-binding protein
MRLDTFDDWKRCITVDCSLSLTAAFIAARIAALSDTRDEHTTKFVKQWGEAHRQRVLGWFRQAAANEGRA